MNRPRRVLIVCPRFPPTNAADMHRVRTSLPHFRDHGWEPVVLAAKPEYTEHGDDPLLLETLPHDAEIHRIDESPPLHARLLGVNSIAVRLHDALNKAGRALLSSRRFDLVYFSTTVFGVMPLGVRWKRAFRVPFVLDFQDPWANRYYFETGVRPPGGWWKFRLVYTQARRLEARTVPHASGLVAVSQWYLDDMRERFPATAQVPSAVIPFGVSAHDFEVPARAGIRHDVFPPGADHRWVYVGRGGEDMHRALGLLFGAIADLRLEESLPLPRLHFVGTSYASGGREEKSVEPLAQQTNVGDLVEERPLRIPYFEAISLMQEATVLLLVGSDDERYNASKLYPALLARRPVLAFVHGGCAAAAAVRASGAGRVVPIEGDPEQSRQAAREAVRWAMGCSRGDVPALDFSSLPPWTAEDLTAAQCRLFNQAVEGATG